MKQFIRFPDNMKAFPLGTDSVVLSSFIRLHKKDRVCDLCTGPGTLSLLLCAKYTDISCVGYELLQDVCVEAQSIVDANNLSERIRIVNQDIRTIKVTEKYGSYDAVVSNPPYFPISSGQSPKDDKASVARTEKFCNLNELISVSSYLLKFGGDFFFVHRPERLNDILYLLRENKLEAKEIRFVKQNSASAPSVVLIRAKKNGNPGMKVLPDFLIQTEDGNFTPEYIAIYET